MTYRVEVAPAALRQLRKLGPPARRRVQAAIELLSDEPRPGGAKKLVGGDGEWRVRTGDYRIVYEIRDSVLLILAVAVGHRRDIYRALSLPRQTGPVPPGSRSRAGSFGRDVDRGSTTGGYSRGPEQAQRPSRGRRGVPVSGTTDLLLHPQRLRIVQAFLGRDRLTTADLRELLPDIPTATLYRQITTLLDGGVLEVVEERPTRGAVERTFALAGDRAVVTPEEAAAMTVDDHRRAFLTFVAGLLADFDRYLDGDSPDLMRDLVGYRQVGLNLTDAGSSR